MVDPVCEAAIELRGFLAIFKCAYVGPKVFDYVIALHASVCFPVLHSPWTYLHICFRSSRFEQMVKQ
jgi:hypothetical protein